MTSTETTTLADFLLARIDEDETAAKGAAKADSDHWRHSDDSVYIADIGAPVAVGPYSAGLGELTATHIARHDPARVLVECEAKRRIVEEHSDGGKSQGFNHRLDYVYFEHACDRCGAHGEYGVPWPCDTLKYLALPYADHELFREEWKL
jgi:uncharacterized protein DUF6221